MKRFLSMMLAVMLVLSSFVMVSASDFLENASFAVSEVPETGAGRWFRFATVETVDGVKTVTEGATVKPFHRISVDVYLTEGVTSANVQANNSMIGQVNEFAVDLTKLNQWQTVVYDVPNGKEITELRFSSNGGKLYYNNIRVDELMAKNLVYEEDFEHYGVDENAGFINKTKTYDDRGDLVNTTEPMTDFDVQTGIGDNNTNVGNLYHPRMRWSSVRTDNDGTPLATQPELLNTTKEEIGGKTYNKVPGQEHYHTTIAELKDKTHIILEMDVYNAANSWANGTENFVASNSSSIKDMLTIGIGKSSSYHTQASELPKVKLEASQFTLTARGTGLVDKTAEHNATAKTWNKLTFELKREQYEESEGVFKWHVDTKATYGGVTLENEVYQAYADDFGNLIMNIDYNYGGRFYVDNIKIYEVVELEDAYVTAYSENFEKSEYTIGNDVPDFTRFEYSSVKTDQASTFTVDSTYDADANPNGKGYTKYDGKYGRVYNNEYYNERIFYEDNGVKENEEMHKTSGWEQNREYHYKNVLPNTASNPSQTKKTRISFKYYLPHSVTHATYATVAADLEIGLTSHDSGSIQGTGIPKVTLTKSSIKINNDSDVNHTHGELKWIPVTIEYTSTLNTENSTTSKARYDHDLKVYSLEFESESASTTTNGVDLIRLCLGVAHDEGGIVYIDDIKVETNVNSTADLAKLDVIPVNNIYTKNVETTTSSDDFVVNTAAFSNDAQSINIVKMPSATAESVKVVTALYNGDVLDSAVINDVDTAALTVFNAADADLTNKLTVPADLTGYKFKVFVFNSEEGLVPLADLFIK